MRSHILTALAVAGLALAPIAASAQPYYTHHHYRHYRSCRHAANTGTVVGAIGGGLVGNALGHHGLGGTLIGAGVGGVAGHQIAKSNCKHG
jgi:hypothetical protein